MASIFRLFTFASVLLAGLGTVLAICHHRDFDFGGTVCVCSQELKCDGEFTNLKISKSKSVIMGIRTTKSGERFLRQEFSFTNETKTEGGILKIVLNPGKKFQKILGFGGAFTDASGINIGKLPKDLQERLMRDYFAEDGLEYTMGRVPIGGSDFSPRAYSLDDHPNDDTLEKFALQPEDLQYKIPYIKLAQSLTTTQIRLFGSAWSAPTWMKTNHEFNHGGFLIGEPGTKYYKLFAKYLVKFLQEYQKANVTGLWGLTVVNEPEFGFNPEWGINVLGFNGTMQRDFVKLDLGPALRDSGFGPEKIKLMINDDNQNMLLEMTNTVLGDRDAAQFVSGVAFHWYGNDGKWQIGPLDELAPKFPNVFFLSTEACELRHVQLGNWTSAELYARDIIHDLNHHTSGWVEWNMALDTSGGPIWAGGKLDASVIVNERTQEYYKQPTFYSLGHFSKFVTPDSVRIHHEVKSGLLDQNFLVTVFERPDASKVATILNRNDHPVKIEIHDPVEGYGFLELPAHSIQSLIWY